MHLILVVSSAAALAIVAVGCGSDAPGSPASSGGQSATGGSTSTGGAATGGQSTTGGSMSTGGTSSGGTSTGGTSTGGTSTGGTSATGGSTSTGGAATGGTSTGGTSTGGTSTTGGSTSTGGAATGGGPAAVGYAKDVQPILKAKCGTCHSGASQGGHNLTTTYADAKKPAESLQFTDCWTGMDPMTGALTGPKPMGECAMLLARAGKMPAFEGCDAPTPPEPAKCVTKAENDILAAWVAGGMAP